MRKNNNLCSSIDHSADLATTEGDARDDGVEEPSP